MVKKIKQGAGVVKKSVQRGGYVHKPITSIIVMCSCGNKYVKTRDQQKVCIRCIQDR